MASSYKRNCSKYKRAMVDGIPTKQVTITDHLRGSTGKNLRSGTSDTAGRTVLSEELVVQQPASSVFGAQLFF